MLPHMLITCKHVLVLADRENGDNFAIKVFGSDFAEYYFCHNEIDLIGFVVAYGSIKSRGPKVYLDK